ncbi:unnamed protein product [Rhodiola kirilowii]
MAANYVNNVRSYAVYVGDLQPDVDNEQLFQAFVEFRSLTSAKVCRDHITSGSRGYGYINFSDYDDAVQAIETKNHMELNGKSVRVMWSNHNPGFSSNGAGNVYIKNLNKSTGNAKLHSMFRNFGNIVSCKVPVAEDGSSKGYGFVQFASQDAADAAIKELNGKTIDDKELYVAPFVPKAVRTATYRNIYVKNLHLDFTEQDFRETFSKFGEISSLTIATDEDGSSKGFGFVNYRNPDDARQAVEFMNGLQFGEKALYVGRAQSKEERRQILRRQFEERRKEQIRKCKDCNLYVKNIAESVKEEMLNQLFSQCGTITSLKVMRNEKGINRGFGFVCFSTPEEANNAVNTFHYYMFHRKPLYVAIAQRKEERQAKLKMQYAQVSSGFVGHASPPVMSGGYSPIFFPGVVAPYPPQTGLMYQPPIPVFRGNAFVPTIRPAFQAPQLPTIPNIYRQYQQARGRMNGYAATSNGLSMNISQRPGQATYVSNGQSHEVNNRTGILPHIRNSVERAVPAELSIFAAAGPERQKYMIGQKLLPLVQQHRPDLAAKITGMLLQQLDNSELLVLLDSPNSLGAKVEEAVQTLMHANATESSQDNGHPVLSVVTVN